MAHVTYCKQLRVRSGAKDIALAIMSDSKMDIDRKPIEVAKYLSQQRQSKEVPSSLQAYYSDFEDLHERK